MATERWVLGPEHNNELLHRLGAVLKEMGFKMNGQWAGVAGSQDISHWEVHSPNGTLVVESETYAGLSIEGPAELVRLVRQRFEASNAF
jgi:hypothetical protein